MATVLEKHEFSVSEPSDNASVVYSTRHLLDSAGLDETWQYLIASAVSELSTNIIRYGIKGTISLLIGKEEGKQYVEIIAEDNGPGIPDVQKALKENFSSGDGLGLGLPSVKRIMDEFDLSSEAGKGVTIRTRKWFD